MFRHSLFRLLTLAAALGVAAGPAAAGPAAADPLSADAVAGGPPQANPVIEWATIVQPAIHSAAAPRSGGTSQILHTMMSLAVYDAVVAIEGGYRPYAAAIDAPRDADVRAAVATAAYLTVRPRLAEVRKPYLDEQYAAYMSAIADGPSKSDGVSVGQQAAEALLALRAHDGFDTTVLYACSDDPLPVGEFEPDAGCPGADGQPQPADVKVGGIQPFTLHDADRYRTSGPAPMGSRTYTRDFIETRDYGRRDSTVRTAEQTDIAYFWSEHPYQHWNRNLVRLAVARKLDVPRAARFFAMVHTAASDAVIAGFAAKYHYRSWRPRTAIKLADVDGNPRTDADTTWQPLLLVNHPEYPSGHGFWSTALIGSVAAFFGTTRVEWTLETSKAAVPQLEVTERTYRNLGTLLGQIGNARIWGGLHWRHAVDHGAFIGGRVALHVATHHFRPVRGRGRGHDKVTPSAPGRPRRPVLETAASR